MHAFFRAEADHVEIFQNLSCLSGISWHLGVACKLEIIFNLARMHYKC